VFVIKKKADMAQRNLCMECGACMRNCPTGAITVEAGEGCVRGVINELPGIEGPCCLIVSTLPGLCIMPKTSS
jgi:ferredoxin